MSLEGTSEICRLRISEYDTHARYKRNESVEIVTNDIELQSTLLTRYVAAYIVAIRFSRQMVFSCFAAESADHGSVNTHRSNT